MVRIMMFLLGRLITWILGIGTMIGYYFSLKYMIYETDPKFGEGFGLGMVLMGALVALTWRVSPESFLGNDKGSKRAVADYLRRQDQGEFDDDKAS